MKAAGVPAPAAFACPDPNRAFIRGCNTGAVARRLLILGSTGSIGTQALDIVGRSDELELVGLSAERSWEALVAQAVEHGVDRIALADADAGARAAEAWTGGEVLVGAEGLVRLVVSHEKVEHGSQAALALRQAATYL